MNYLDELLALYPGRDVPTRRFLLSQVLDHAVDRFSDEVIEFLWTESLDAERVVGRQARHVMGRYIAGHSQRVFRVGANQSGVWTGAMKVGEAPRALERPVNPDEVARMLRAAAS